MKTFSISLYGTLALLVVFRTTSAEDEEWKPKTSNEIKVIRRECLAEAPLSEEQIARMKEFDFPDEEGVRKYLQCTAEKLGIFCPQQGYHTERLAKQFKMNMDESEVLTIAQGCVDNNTDGSTIDVWAFRGHQCLMESKVGDRVRAYIKRRKEDEATKAAADSSPSASA